MRVLPVFAACALLLVGCGNGDTGGASSNDDMPSAAAIKNALQQKYRDGLQKRVDDLSAMVGEQRAKEALVSAEGTVDPGAVRVTAFQAEGLRRLDNGDVTAKVVYVLEKGQSVRIDRSERVTLTRLQGNWIVTEQEPLG